MIDKKYQVLKRQMPAEQKYVYKKADVLYQITYAFTQRFLVKQTPDRTVDQMVQAARSGKQNIIEGVEDGQSSTEIHIKLLTVAKGSLKELRQDYKDYLISRQLQTWTYNHPRFEKMRQFCRDHNEIVDYQPYLNTWTDEEMANTALTLCFITDTMLTHELERLEANFVEHGGIKERMHAARTGYRQAETEELQRLRAEVPQLQAEIARLQAILQQHEIAF